MRGIRVKDSIEHFGFTEIKRCVLFHLRHPKKSDEDETIQRDEIFIKALYTKSLRFKFIHFSNNFLPKIKGISPLTISKPSIQFIF